MQNPFVFGVATDEEHFTDRTEDTHRLLQNFRHGVNSMIISPRRWGKTSLVHKVSRLAQSPTLKVVNIDIFACRNREDFYHLFATEVIKQSASKWEEWAENAKNFLVSLMPKISFGVDPLTDFSIALDFSNKRLNDEVLHLPERIATQKNIKIVICIDEFQQIAEFHESLEFQKQLRSVWQLQKNVSYCLYGSKKHIMSELFSKQNSPFYQFGDMFFLEKISSKDWIPFICDRFRTTNKTINPEFAEQICRIADNHSSYVQQLSWNVWVRTKESVNQENIDEALEQLIKQNSMLYYQYTEGLTAYQINYLKAVADGIQDTWTATETLKKYNLGTSGNIKRLKDALQKKELIDTEGANVYFNDPIFKIWFMRNIS